MLRSSRRTWDSKEELLSAGSLAEALLYQRASRDKRRRTVREGKSVKDQLKLNTAEVATRGWTLGESFTDNDRSGSRHAKREREDFKRLIEHIESGRGDVLVLWEIARGQRDLAVYVQVRDICLKEGLNFWLVGGVLYDLRDRNDRLSLGTQALQAEYQADGIREGILRGINGSAEEGMPHSVTPYGYRRIYHPRTREFLRQEQDDEVREAVADDGQSVRYARCDVVREIMTRISESVPLTVIERDLNSRGIPSPSGGVDSRDASRHRQESRVYREACAAR